ncbi:sensor histidine kinase [Flavobacterium aurantiibacter]|uniref:histidine kinase n=1 Tax=Flavobacterium aurantiibacter TaxID=2023067 RepID=A0A255ZXC8_9FLAO|nr:PAS domain-containing protein [Flavobacterium aurantiibacter]OYQ46143.1 PAS domain-containing sensor histidine kinase [Flavobacterium aurantiibacter]
MKSNANKITVVFVLVAAFVAIVSVVTMDAAFSSDTFDHLYLHIARDLVFIILTAFVLRYFIIKNDQRNRDTLRSLEERTKAIKQANERYDIVAKATSDTIWDWNIPTDHFEWNKGIFEIFGYGADDIENNSSWWFSKIHPQDSMRISVNLYAFLAQKSQNWQAEYRFLRKDGSYRYVLDRGFLVFGPDARPVRMIGAMQDVTRLKKEERRLKLLETVITNTLDSILITDADNSKFPIPQIVFVNKAFANMTGFDELELLQMSPYQLYDLEENRTLLDELVLAIAQKKTAEMELKSARKDGARFWVRFSFVPVFDNEGEHTHWISIQRDVSKQKEQEKEREQLIRELSQNNKDLRQFSYITSHNLRAPISNLIGLLQLLEEEQIDNETVKLIVEGFSKSTHLLQETVNDLGKVVIIRDNPSIEKQLIDPLESLNRVKMQIDNLINISEVNMELNFEPEVELYVNRAYFESILLNLLTNAVKYRNKKRPLKIVVSLRREEQFDRLSFADNGLGIDLEKHGSKVFGLYQRFHNLPDSKGLGLYLVKSQVESMGGRIEIASSVGCGTTFMIDFQRKL